MLRVVFDTNGIVSAFIQPTSPPGVLLARVIQGGALELTLSMAILEEVSRAMHYPSVRKSIRATDQELALRLAMLDTLSSPVDIQAEALGVSRDPDDDKSLATAVAGCADYIVTGDNDLLTLGEYEGIRIMTPRAFLELLDR